MRVGIIGATGFIGQAVGKAAHAAGWQVIAYSRQGRVAKLPWAGEVRELNVGADLPINSQGVDVMIHLAGESVLGLWTKAKKQRLWDSRVTLTEKIVNCLAQHPPQAFICGSAVGYYGDAADAVLTEQAPAGSDFLAKLCVAWEAAAMQAQQRHHIRTALVRTGMVLGTEGGAFPLMRRAFAWGGGGKLGTGGQYMPWIHLADEVQLILWAAQHASASGPLNACAPQPVTNAAFTQSLSQLLRRPAFFHTPSFILRAVLGEMASMLLASQRAMPARAQELGFVFQHPELKTALQDLLSAKH
jgi:uncharacterized protein